jgi:PncC family amidohydrolase
MFSWGVLLLILMSEEVALKMAESVAQIFNSDFSISATGIAGPGGGSVEKPVGTVYTGFKYNTDYKVVKHHFWGIREKIRFETANYCINQLILYLRAL